MNSPRFPERRLLTYATVFTLLRAVLITPIVWCIVSHHELSALLLGAVALVTDFIDGMLARAFHEETVLGARLDHIVDKCFALALAVAIALTGVDQGFEAWIFALGVIAGVLTVMFQLAMWSMKRRMVQDVWDKSVAVLGMAGLILRSGPLPHVVGDVVILAALMGWFVRAVRAAYIHG